MSGAQKTSGTHSTFYVTLQMAFGLYLTLFFSVLKQCFLREHFGNMMCPLPLDKDISKVTLKWMIEQHYQVIFIYRNQMGNEDSQLWPSKSWPTPWPETTSVQNMISFLENGLSHRPSNTGTNCTHKLFCVMLTKLQP